MIFLISLCARTAAGSAKQVMGHVDALYNVRQRVMEAARSTVSAAQRTNRDRRVADRAAGAAEATAQVCASGDHMLVCLCMIGVSLN